jgi:hypothetical protein
MVTDVGAIWVNKEFTTGPRVARCGIFNCDMYGGPVAAHDQGDYHPRGYFLSLLGRGDVATRSKTNKEAGIAAGHSALTAPPVWRDSTW